MPCSTLPLSSERLIQGPFDALGWWGESRVEAQTESPSLPRRGLEARKGGPGLNRDLGGSSRHGLHFWE